MYFLYSVLLSVGFIALLPRFIYDALRHGKYVAGFRERLGQLPGVNANGRPIIWLHCVSVGETQAARPLVRALRREFPSHSLVVSTITLTGQRVAQEVFCQDAAAIFYFPFDWAWTVRRALRALRPSLVLLMETELWPNFLRECRRHHVPVALVNGRLSAGSFRRYKYIRRFIARVVGHLDVALMQTEADAVRIRALGLTPDRVAVSGNVKFDIEAAGESALTSMLRERFRLKDGRPLIVAASTHSPEEHIILEAFTRLRAVSGDLKARLLIAPRHPERFAGVASSLESSGLAWTRRSGPPTALDQTCDVILLDTIGELRAVYTLADLVFVGGSISRTGGHNVLEPAAAGACVITGAHTSNFAEIVRAFLEADALIQLPPVSGTEAVDALARAFAEILTDDERRRAIATQARAVLERNRGATERTIRRLATLLPPSPERSKLVQAHGARPDAISA
ncbi:MAG TPA: 3-deoxy-D-manno-octulosonic acid transferase [Pyrinomonadaceae bacterium]|nr:3-deoxy-D-manno-octulosonic acid transferase [Pyrinomonadaceae bacterium]